MITLVWSEIIKIIVDSLIRMLSNIWYFGILNIERDLLSSILEFQIQNDLR